jgi:WD40 repeat protein
VPGVSPLRRQEWRSTKYLVLGTHTRSTIHESFLLLTVHLVLHLLSLVLLAATPAPPIVALVVSPDGGSVITASQAGVQVLSLPDLQLKRTLPTQIEQPHDLEFSPAGNMLAIAGGSPAERGAVELWSWPEGKLLRTLPAGNDVANSLDFSADGSQLAIAGADKAVYLQPTSGGPARILRPHSAAVLAVAWLTADDLVLSAGVDQTIRVIKPTSGETLRSFENHTAPVRALAVQPGKHDGPALVASASADRTVRFWQPIIGRLVRFARLPAAATAICWTPSGSHALAACEDGKLRAINPATVEVTDLPEHLDGWAYAIAVLPDGVSAVLGGERGQLRKVSLNVIVGNVLRGVP